MSEINLTGICSGIITIIIALITTFAIPWLKEKRLYSWVVIAVKAAEQIYKESGMGSLKKKFVLEFLGSKGYKIDTDAIDLMIESAVNSLKENSVQSQPNEE